MKEGEADEIGENNTITAAFLISYENGSVLYNTMPKRIATAYRITNTLKVFLNAFLSKCGSSNRPIINIAIGPFAPLTIFVNVYISFGTLTFNSASVINTTYETKDGTFNKGFSIKSIFFLLFFSSTIDLAIA